VWGDSSEKERETESGGGEGGGGGGREREIEIEREREREREREDRPSSHELVEESEPFSPFFSNRADIPLPILCLIYSIVFMEGVKFFGAKNALSQSRR
jgi:hypothetical protein